MDGKQASKNLPCPQDPLVEFSLVTYKSVSYEKYLIIKFLGGQSIIGTRHFFSFMSIALSCKYVDASLR